MNGWEIRDRRRAAGLTLRAVATAAGTCETNVSAYERGTKRPGRRTLTRLLAVIDVGADSPLHRNRLLTVPATAAAIRAGLRARWSTADLLRLVREMRSNAKFAMHADAERAAFLAEPSTTGDQRWDALLAGATEDLAMRQDVPVPPWVAGHALPQFWWVNPSPAARAYVFANTPFPMRVRGVMIDPASLESV